MSWKDILKVDLREARMLGRKHAPEEMSEGKLKIKIEKEIANVVMKMSTKFGTYLRDGSNSDRLKDWITNSLPVYGFSHNGESYDFTKDVKIHDVNLKPQKNRDRGDFANVVLNDPYPEEKATITIEYSIGPINNEKFSFVLPPMAKEYSSDLRRPETKRVKGSMKQRDINQHIGFDRKEDI